MRFRLVAVRKITQFYDVMNFGRSFVIKRFRLNIEKVTTKEGCLQHRCASYYLVEASSNISIVSIRSILTNNVIITFVAIKFKTNLDVDDTQLN
jgi:hypothetical protein